MSRKKNKHAGFVLKIAIFATGCAGIVAEFVLSTLATYLVGNAVFQWTVVMSIMLFAMGLGSRLSKEFKNHLLDVFILTEFVLSVLCASSAVLAYSAAGLTAHLELLIYGLALAVGLLIGFEIPLVTRINQRNEALRTNIASVMEKDYYGSLVGGMFFAFFALPHLGLVYTPVILGGINFAVATGFLFFFFPMIHRKETVLASFGMCLILLAGIAFFSEPVVLYGEQTRYRDKIILSRQTPYQKIVMTRWRSHYWLYINGQEQFSTFDEERYHEPLVHPAMTLAPYRNQVLILGGGDGLALRDVFKYPDVKKVDLVDLDPVMTDLAKTHPVLIRINNNSMRDHRLSVINRDAKAYLLETDALYDVVIADLPDPDTVELTHLYTKEFYGLVKKRLVKGGIFVTQATSPFFSSKAFQCIIQTVQKAGFSVLPYHNQVPTMGEWGWVLAMKSDEINEESLKKWILGLNLDRDDTRFLNTDAMVSMAHFGKDENLSVETIRINTEFNPVLHTYYDSKAWEMY